MSKQTARYRLWGRRLYPDQTEIDTFIDFIRFWFGLDKNFISFEDGGKVFKTDIYRNILLRLFVFENFLPAHVWSDPSQKFTSILKDLSGQFDKKINSDKKFSTLIQSVENSEDISTFTLISRWMASLNISRSLDISARAKGREKWWAQYFPPYSEEMLSHEIFIDEKPGEGRRPFSDIEKPKYVLTARSGELTYWLLSSLGSDQNRELNNALLNFYEEKNPYSVIFNLMTEFLDFYFYDRNTDGESNVRTSVLNLISEIHREDFHQLLIKIKGNISNKNEDHTFPTNVCSGEKDVYKKWSTGLKNIISSSSSRDVAVLRASKYLVWCNIKYLIVRSKKKVLEQDSKSINFENLIPEILTTFPGVDGLQALVQKARICYNDVHRTIELAHGLEMKSMTEEGLEYREDLERKRFNAEHGSYLTRRGKKLGVVYPPSSGGRHFFTVDESFLDVLVAANFPSDGDDIMEFTEFTELLRTNEGLVFDLSALKRGKSLKLLVNEETSGFDLNIRVLKDRIRNLGILQEASDSNAYVLKPNKNTVSTQ